MKLTKAEKIALKAFFDEYEDSFCGTRAGKNENDDDAFLCPACPFNEGGLCKLRNWTRRKFKEEVQDNDVR